MSYFTTLPEIGTSIIGRAATATLYVSPNGNGSDGLTWASAYTTLQDALDAASTDDDALTLIMVGPHVTNYDIDREDPSWAANVMIKGSHRTWAKIVNNHASAGQVLKFSGKAALCDININLGTSNNGVIYTGPACRMNHCQIVGEDLTSAKTGVWIDGATTRKNSILNEVHFQGDQTYMIGLLLDNCASNYVKWCTFHDCLTGIQIVNASSVGNYFNNIDIGVCTTGIDIDAGVGQHFIDVVLHGCTTNVDDEVGGHVWRNIQGEFDVTVEPLNLTGVEITAGNGDWGGDTELRAAATATKPFKVLAYNLAPSDDETTLIRFSADSGSTYFTQDVFASKKDKATSGGDAVDFIFNVGTRISASVWSPDSGRTVNVWLEILEF